MIKENDRQVLLCKGLQRLGFAPKQRVRLYGEEFDLVSEPIPDDSGYVIKAISRKSGIQRHVRIPRSVTQVVEHEILLTERVVLAA